MEAGMEIVVYQYHHHLLLRHLLLLRHHLLPLEHHGAGLMQACGTIPMEILTVLQASHLLTMALLSVLKVVLQEVDIIMLVVESNILVHKP
jgi:hypothetical protein